MEIHAGMLNGNHCFGGVFLHWILLLFKKMYGCFACMYVCLYIQCMCLLALRGHRRVSDSQDWSYRQLWVTLWVLGIELRSFGRAALALNCWTISPANTSLTLLKSEIWLPGLTLNLLVAQAGFELVILRKELGKQAGQHNQQLLA